MEEIIISICVAIAEVLLAHMLFTEIFEKNEQYEKYLKLFEIVMIAVIFGMEMMENGILIILMETGIMLIFGCIFFDGNINKKIYYIAMYAVIYLASRVETDFMKQIYEVDDKNNYVMGMGKYADVVFVLIITFLLTKYMIYQNKKNTTAEVYGETYKMFTIMPVSTSLLICAIYYSDIYEYGAGNSLILLFAIEFLVIANIVMQGMFEKYTSMKASEYAGNIRKLKSDMEQRYYQNMEKSNREYIELMHNVKHHFSAIRGMAQNNKEITDYLSEVDNRLASVTRVIYTENKMFNAILSEKKDKAQAKGIECDIKVDKDIDTGIIPDTDIIEIVGNIIDNAIEAVEKISNKQYKVNNIKIRSYMSNDNKFFVFCVENPYEILEKTSKGIFKTTKKDKEKHGIGLKSVESLAEKNSGYVNILTEKNTFKIIVNLPIFLRK